jgi:hypothetical protein
MTRNVKATSSTPVRMGPYNGSSRVKISRAGKLAFLIRYTVKEALE